MNKSKINFTNSKATTAVLRLPENWVLEYFKLQYQIYKKQKSQKNCGKSILALTLLANTGCKASEIQNGLYFQILNEDKFSISFIEKINSEEAIKRVLIFQNVKKSKEISFFFETVKIYSEKKSKFYFEYKANRINEVLNNLNRKSADNHKSFRKIKISTTIFRYQFAANLFSSGLYSNDEIRKILGYKDIRSLEGYPTGSNTNPLPFRFITIEDLSDN